MTKKIDPNNWELNGGQEENPVEILTVEAQVQSPFAPAWNDLSIWPGETRTRRR